MIAISYRRDDSLPVAGRLYDRLEQRFGRQNVFMDFDSIRPGFDFRDQIKETIERSRVVIAIIGPNWLGKQDDGSRRIDNPTDFVRLEVGYALQRGIPVIPVLLNDTPMPTPETLPSDIQALAFRHAVPLDSGLDFRQHAERLVMGIQGIIGDKGGSRHLTAPQPKNENADAQVKSLGGRKYRILATGLVVLLTAAIVLSAWFWGRRLVEDTTREVAATPTSEAKLLPTPSPAIERPEATVSDMRHPVVSATPPPSPISTPSGTVTPIESTTPVRPQETPNGPTLAKNLTSVYVKKYGFSVLLPVELFPNAATAFADPQVDRVESPNGCASATFRVVATPLKTTYSSYLSQFPNSAEGKSLDYKVLKPQWFVVSGSTWATGFYTKGVRRGDETILMELEYTGSVCNIPEALLTEISRKFDGTAR
jgi:hypothetical protein